MSLFKALSSRIPSSLVHMKLSKVNYGKPFQRAREVDVVVDSVSRFSFRLTFLSHHPSSWVLVLWLGSRFVALCIPFEGFCGPKKTTKYPIQWDMFDLCIYCSWHYVASGFRFCTQFFYTQHDSSPQWHTKMRVSKWWFWNLNMMVEGNSTW